MAARRRMSALTTSGGVLMLVLDSADAQWLRHWSGQGHLPHFKALTERAMTGPVHGSPGVYSVASWFSLATGTQPPTHGRHSWTQFDRFSYDFARPAPRAGDPPALWQVLDLAGRRVAVVDYPRAPLSTLRHGVQIVDWNPHDLADGGIRSCPAGLADEVIERFGPDPCRGHCDAWTLDAPGDYRAFVDAMLERVRVKVACFERLWRRAPWELFCLSFGEAHCSGHRCWHVQHADHPWHDPAIAGEVAAPVLDVYRALDAAIGRILDIVGAEHTVLLLANPGMEHQIHAADAMGEALERINAHMPHGLPPALSRDDWPSAFGAGVPAQRQARRAMALSFPVPVGNAVFAVRFNLAGRERFGRLRPGAEAGAYGRELAEELMAISHAHDGSPVFCEMIPTAATYGCGDDHDLPDLMLTWSRARPITTLGSATTGMLQARQGRTRSGDHRPLGLYALRSRKALPADGPGVRDVDIGVTLGAMLGAPLPDAEGSVIDDWLGAASL